MRTTKLNKTQTWELIQNAVANAVAETDTLKKGTEEKFTAELLSQLEVIMPKTGGNHSDKINAAGEVYCNYFDTYFEADCFNTKMSKPDAEGNRRETYKANCKDAEMILRKIKTIKKNVETQAMTNFRDKTITAEEMEQILNNMDTMLSNKFTSVDEVPTVADIIGL